VSERNIFTPTQLVRLAKELLEDAFPLIWVEGEISNFTAAASGHWYFTLKDQGAGVRSAMFKGRSLYVRERPRDGQRVLIRARVSLYEARGEFQLICEHLEDAGAGAIQRQFEMLKEKLAAEGLFAAQLKRPLPRLVRHLAIISSASGAAIHDIYNVLARRFPLIRVTLFPTLVQGAGAAEQITQALISLQTHLANGERFDAVLLTRGGGSLEDLQAFNDEQMARQIRAMSIPVVSAVGHEIDFTIADFVADIRAPTPSAAAELLTPDQSTLRQHLHAIAKRCAVAARRKLEPLSMRLDGVVARLSARTPQQHLQRQSQMLMRSRSAAQRAAKFALQRIEQNLAMHAAQLRFLHPAIAIKRLRQRQIDQGQRLWRLYQLDTVKQRNNSVRRMFSTAQSAATQHLLQQQRRLQELKRTAYAVSPQATLDRGYALIFDATKNAVISHVNAAAPGQKIRVRLADGTLHSVVERAQPDE
jgi:exodeoxyribonuclease VII large subunit